MQYSNCNRQSADFLNKYRLQETYLPNENSPTYIVKINFNIWQKGNGTGNWQNTPEFLQKLDTSVNWLNNYFIGHNKQPSHPLPGITHIADTKIRFEYDVYFNPVEQLYGNTSRTILQNYLQQNYPERLDAINIHIAYDPDLAGGNANTPAFNDNINLSILMINNNADPESNPIVSWGFTLNVAHELGHSLDLLHTYRPTCCHETSNTSHHDFLCDVLEQVGENVWPCADPYNGVCFHNYGWGCSVSDPVSGCTNNLMGGTMSSGYKSPMQIGRMRRALALKTTRKYASGYHEIPYTVTQNETWDFSIKLYQDLIIEPSKTLIIKCDVQMVPNAKIVIKRGGKLIVDGGRIGTDYFSKEPWQGIFVEGRSDLPQSPSQVNKWQGALILKNGAII